MLECEFQPFQKIYTVLVIRYAEKLEKIIEGRQKWEAKERPGGSTNIEKKRKKSFVMSKFSYGTRKKVGEKNTAKHGRAKDNMKLKHDRAASKRRRKF